MSDNKERIVQCIIENDYKSFKDYFSSITNKGEANYSLKKESTNVSIERRTNYGRYEKEETQNNEGIPKDGLTLLHVAAYYDSLDCFRLIEREGKLRLRSPSSRGFYPLHYACYNGSNEVALYILTKDPSQAQAHPEGIGDLHFLFCATKGTEPEILQALFDNGAKISDPWNNEDKLISAAIALHDREILSILMKYQTGKGASNIDTSKGTPSMKAVTSFNVDALEILYNKNFDLTASFIDRGTYYTLISLICETDVKKMFKNFFKKILIDARDVQIEPEYIPGQNHAGVCHWACMYADFEIAKLMLKTPNVQINRLDENFRTGAFKLTVKKGNDTIKILELLYNHGFNINAKKDDKSQSLLEAFMLAMTKNYQAIEFLVNHGADVNAIYTKQPKFTLIEFVRSRSDAKLKKIFGITK